VVFPPQTKDLAHFHSRPPLDLLIEVEELPAQAPRCSFADRRLTDAWQSDKDQMRR